MKFCSLRGVHVNENKWQDYSFVMPTVSIGNVGQLAVDLFIANLEAKVIGYFCSDCVIPVAGFDPFSETSCNLTTSLDVFECSKSKLVILQQRATFIEKRQSRFISELADWIEEKKFKRVIILTSVLACERVDSQLTGPQCRYIVSTTSESILEGGVVTPNIPMLERSAPDIGANSVDNIHIPGSGIAKKLFENFRNKGKEVIILLRFCYEADNSYDAIDLAKAGNSIFSWIPIHISESRWKIPPSWKCLYGHNPDRIIYQ